MTNLAIRCMVTITIGKWCMIFQLQKHTLQNWTNLLINRKSNQLLYLIYRVSNVYTGKRQSLPLIKTDRFDIFTIILQAAILILNIYFVSLMSHKDIYVKHRILWQKTCSPLITVHQIACCHIVHTNSNEVNGLLSLNIHEQDMLIDNLGSPTEMLLKRGNNIWHLARHQ